MVSIVPWTAGSPIADDSSFSAFRLPSLFDGFSGLRVRSLSGSCNSRLAFFVPGTAGGLSLYCFSIHSTDGRRRTSPEHRFGPEFSHLCLYIRISGTQSAKKKFAYELFSKLPFPPGDHRKWSHVHFALGEAIGYFFLRTRLTVFRPLLPTPRATSLRRSRQPPSLIPTGDRLLFVFEATIL